MYQFITVLVTSLTLLLCVSQVHANDESSSNSTQDNNTSSTNDSTTTTAITVTTAKEDKGELASLIVAAGLVPGFILLFCLILLIPKWWNQKQKRDMLKDVERATRYVSFKTNQYVDNPSFASDETSSMSSYQRPQTDFYSKAMMNNASSAKGKYIVNGGVHQNGSPYTSPSSSWNGPSYLRW